MCGGTQFYQIDEIPDEEQRIIKITCDKCGIDFHYNDEPDKLNDLFPIIHRN